MWHCGATGFCIWKALCVVQISFCSHCGPFGRSNGFWILLSVTNDWTVFAWETCNKQVWILEITFKFLLSKCFVCLKKYLVLLRLCAEQQCTQLYFDVTGRLWLNATCPVFARGKRDGYILKSRNGRNQDGGTTEERCERRCLRLPVLWNTGVKSPLEDREITYFIHDWWLWNCWHAENIKLYSGPHS